jgi:DNA-binding FrmR family transcriptional regulator
VERPDVVVSDVRKRLHRAAGQVAAVDRMLEEGRDCKEIVNQLSAASRALEQAGFRLVSAGLVYCLSDPEKAEAEGYPLAEVEKMFMRIG